MNVIKIIIYIKDKEKELFSKWQDKLNKQNNKSHSHAIIYYPLRKPHGFKPDDGRVENQ
jgi:hypothetical protein